jgi:ribonuclease HII
MVRKKPKKTKKKIEVEPMMAQFSEQYIEAGCDEVGRGCLAGPVVAAAVILPKNFNIPLLTDSKMLSKDIRDRLESEIKSAALAWAIGSCDNREIDQINILNASFKAMHRALDQLTLRPELILIDGNRFAPYKFIPYHCIIKGDSKYLSIAAASVLAKCYRDNLMENYAEKYPAYHWQTNVGYPTIAHRKALKCYGPTSLHRMSFRLLKEEKSTQSKDSK